MNFDIRTGHYLRSDISVGIDAVAALTYLTRALQQPQALHVTWTANAGAEGSGRDVANFISASSRLIAAVRWISSRPHGAYAVDHLSHPPHCNAVPTRQLLLKLRPLQQALRPETFYLNTQLVAVCLLNLTQIDCPNCIPFGTLACTVAAPASCVTRHKCSISAITAYFFIYNGTFQKIVVTVILAISGDIKIVIDFQSLIPIAVLLDSTIAIADRRIGIDMPIGLILDPYRGLSIDPTLDLDHSHVQDFECGLDFQFFTFTDRPYRFISWYK
ncbi:hypothetical protein EVAR_93616_1 [Eumeta japonica]|uniref:Uncharacterized protein n=1 Tax=Eumeta variegata TaxID=151549 RepID=A0A4C1TQJ9_EUMVA|nr:hypothetical protein EVAR_93616_1 [Eumeta japonica]